jgi:hypothetical protein
MRYASKRALVDDIEAEHVRLIDLLGTIPASRRREPGVWGDGWTVSDLVAHLAAWHLMFLRWHREGREGRRPALPAPGYTWRETPALNRAIWQQHRRTSYGRALRDFERSYEQLLALASSLPPKALFEPGHIGWSGTAPLATYLSANTASHYRFARKVLTRWLRRSPAAR